MRCTLFHRRFHNRRIRLHVLRGILKQAGITKKKVITRRVAARKEERIKEFREMTIKLAEKMEQVYNGGKHLLWVDECVFAAQGYQQSAWSAPKENVTVEDRLQYQSCQAVIGAVCSCHGLWAWEMKEKSYKQKDFIEFIKTCNNKGDQKLVLYLDNCSAHSCTYSKK